MWSKKFQLARSEIEAGNFSLASRILDEIPQGELSDVGQELHRVLYSKLQRGEKVIGEVAAASCSSDAVNYSQSLTEQTFFIVTPAFNSARYLNETIESVFLQKGNFDIFYHVQDGGSTDGTIQILKDWEYRSKHEKAFERSRIFFSWSSDADKGMYEAVSRGIDLLNSKVEVTAPDKVIVTWINSDDMLGLNSLKTVAGFFSSKVEFHWLTGLGSTIDEGGAITAVFDRPAAYSRTMLQQGLYDGRHHPSFVCQEGTFWRFSLWQQAGGINNIMKFAGDWDLWRRFAALTPLIKIEAVLAFHRRHAAQLSHDKDKYYEELDSYITPKDLNKAELEETGFRAVYDPVARQWNAIQAKTDSALTKSIEISGQKRGHSLSDKRPPQRGPNGKSWPKISVITPTYNQGKYIRDTIESVLNQNYPNLEFIIIDGGSTDKTVSIINEYKGQISYFVSEKDNGQSQAINKGFAQATGDLFTWLNSDDQFAPEALFSMAMAFETSEADMVAGICEVYEEDKLIHRHMTSCQDGVLPIDPILELDTGWNAGQFFYQPEVFFRKSLWEKAGGHVREDCFYSMDYEMWCRFAAVKAKLHVIGKPIVRFRSHPEQKTADPALFKAELTGVKEKFLKEWSITPGSLTRPPLNWARRLKVALVNDHGYKYGAGIAHQRIAAGFQLAGHEISSFDLNSYAEASINLSENKLCSEVENYSPDVVIFGNIHSATKDSVYMLSRLEAQYPTFWLTHDFWLLTGRCAYTQGCVKHQSGCDSSCPTSNEYPALEPDKINAAWEEKRELIKKSERLTLLANSSWAKQFAQSSLSNFPNDVKVEKIKLGVPTEIFIPANKKQAKRTLGVTENNFTIAFSVSSLSDERKGGHLFIEALNELNLPGITVILIGHLDEEFPVDNIQFITLGYVEHAELLVTALNAADVVVGPSIEETLGQVFLEAAMCGTPSIGFDTTGVKDAIIDGVTGIKVAEMNSRSLMVAIASLYHDRNYAAELGNLARIYAANEFSIEASYRSFYSIFDKAGLIDRWEMPHKIAFSKYAELLGCSDESWFGLKGLSPKEGPYPEHGINHKFNWCCGDEIILNVKLNDGCDRLVMQYLNPLFNDLSLNISLNELFLGESSLEKTSRESKAVAVNFPPVPKGLYSLRVVPNMKSSKTASENRELVFKLLDLSF